MTSRILIIGACGQIGSELTYELRQLYGNENVVASDINYANLEVVNSGIFEIVDATDYASVKICVEKHNIDTVYLMAAMLSAIGEKYPRKAWDLNINSLFNVLNLAKGRFIKRVFWPSSIAVFGPTTPKINTPQFTAMEPATVYGITKQVGERWCEYYHNKYNVDVRSLRYPGIISWKTPPGGGTTDYAIEIYHKAITNNHYDCFLSENTKLPMMFMPDAIRATIEIMSAESSNVKIRSSYNVSALSLAPKQIAQSIEKHISGFTVSYLPDYRQEIADTWPESINDLQAREDWYWSHSYTLEKITNKMLMELDKVYNQATKNPN